MTEVVSPCNGTVVFLYSHRIEDGTYILDTGILCDSGHLMVVTFEPDTQSPVIAENMKLLSPDISVGSSIPGLSVRFIGVCGTDFHIAVNGGSAWIRALPEELSRRSIATVEGVAFETVGNEKPQSSFAPALEKIKEVISAKKEVKEWSEMVCKFWYSNPNAFKFMQSSTLRSSLT